MRYASSLLYGGMLVDAEKANYQDYSKLLLRCPFCGEPVFLSAASYRAEHARLAPKSKKIVLVRETNVSASFNHYHGLAENCELRSRTISDRDIQCSFVKGRNQRLKFFQKRFWEILTEGKEDEKFYSIRELMHKANPFVPAQILDKAIADTINDIGEKFKNADHKYYASEILRQAMEHPDELIVAETSSDRIEAINWLMKLEMDLHLQIVQEACDYLCTKSARELLFKTIDLGLTYCIDLRDEQLLLDLVDMGQPSIQKLNENYKDFVTSIVSAMLAQITGIQWAKAINDLR